MNSGEHEHEHIYLYIQFYYDVMHWSLFVYYVVTIWSLMLVLGHNLGTHVIICLVFGEYTVPSFIIL